MNTLIIEKARSLGFISIGFSRPQIPLYFDKFLSWLSLGNNAEMKWLERNLEIRKDPSRLLENCQTIITLAFPYSKNKHRTKDGYSIARYSEPLMDDYHSRLGLLCGELSDLIKQQHNGNARVCVDSAPILEKSFAFNSGMGFIGKNNMFIIPEYGSYLYLAEILTTVRFDAYEPGQLLTQCGSCDLCLKACPTGALKGPYSLDASKCLSYLTIEYKGQIDDWSANKTGGCFMGCDRCQEACPFNDTTGDAEISLPSTDDIIKMDAGEFKRMFRKTALARPGLEKLKENIIAIKKAQEIRKSSPVALDY
jgi:epoxyqueuosine reductase